MSTPARIGGIPDFDLKLKRTMTRELIDTHAYTEHDKEYYTYKLKGMVIHSGNAQGGHYYSYIKVKTGTGGEKDVWLEFNDTTVREFPYSKLEDNCFGGKK